jgi:selenide,water dikinase
VLVGIETLDDAGVYRLGPELALIQTVDFFTPVVDDPYLFGQIAAANALSDVYAMGGDPLTAMNIVCFPTRSGDPEVLAAILRGGLDKLKEAGAVLLGGHSVEDAEPKYGLAVTGVCHPARVITNAGARPGDLLVLTKPLGTGVITTALKAECAPPEAFRAAAEAMTALNRDASLAMREVGVHACTDITGFGLLGHALEMARAGGVALRFAAGAVPLLPGARDLAAQGFVPGGTYANRQYLAGHVTFDPAVPEELQMLLYDPQTSGGLLMAVAPERLAALLNALRRRNVAAAVVGRVEEGEPRIHVGPQTPVTREGDPFAPP